VKALTSIVLAAGLAASQEANATPFTYQFNMPTWDSTNSAAVYGTSSVLDVTVDNGGISDISQTYDFGQLTSATVTAVGGTFTHTWPGLSTFSSTDPSIDFLTTDSSGIPTLDLLVEPIANRVTATDSNIFFQLARNRPSGIGFSSYFINDETVGAFAFVNGPDTCDIACGFEVTGASVSSSVPEPSTLALFGTGLVAALGWSRRRRKVKHAGT
jgi:hypothetical protein